MATSERLGRWLRSPLHEWKRIDDFIVEDFMSQARDDRAKKHFNEALYASIEKRAEEQRSQAAKWGTANLVLVAILVANIFSVHFDISVAGLRFTDTSIARELILFASSTLGFVVGLIALHAGVLKKVALRAREEVVPKHFNLANIARLNVVEALSATLRSYSNAYRHRDPAHLFGMLMLLLIWLLGFLYLIINLGLYFYVHLLIMWDIWHGPSLSVFWSHVVVIYALTLDCCSFVLILLTQTLPLRYRNWEIVAQYKVRAEQSETAAQLYLEDIIRKASRRRG